MTQFIALGGHRGSGKDAVADHLVDQHGFTKIGMSDLLLQATLAANPLIRVTIREALRLRIRPGHIRAAVLVERVGYVKAKTVRDFREFMQHFGTEAGRDIHGQDVWVNLIAKRIDALRAEGHDVVLTGVRFPNELTMADVRGRTWWVSRPGYGGDNHPSERSVNAANFQRIVDNDRRLSDLYWVVDTLIGF